MKWALREAVDVYFKAKSAFKLGARTFRAGEPVLIFDTVTTGTLEGASEMSYVTGGRGNSRLLAFEGDKTLSFSFEDALLSAEGLAILAGAELIPARNKNLNGASPEARHVVAHYTEKYSVSKGNRIDTYEGNTAISDINRRNYFIDSSLGDNVTPRGGEDNIWLTRKPYVGQNGSIYVMLLDDAGEISGAPIEINLSTSDVSKATKPETKPTTNSKVNPAYDNTKDPTYEQVKSAFGLKDGDAPADIEVWGKWKAYYNSIARHSSELYLRKFNAGDEFVAFDYSGNPIAREEDTTQGTTIYKDPTGIDAARFDDGVAHYVDIDSAIANWVTGWGAPPDKKDPEATNQNLKWTRQIPADAKYEDDWNRERTEGSDAHKAYAYLLAPSGGVAQPKCFKEGSQFVYKVNVPSILYQDIVLIDYYVEYVHNAVQVSILPDKFAPYMYVEGSSLLRRASDGMDLPVEFVIPKFKITTSISFTFQSTGDASTFNFQGDAYPDFTKFDLTRKVLADIQILDADDNYDGAAGDISGDPTSYRRYQYNEDTDGDYIWKDPALEAHSNLDYSDAHYEPTHGGPASVNEDSQGNGQIFHD